MSILTELAHGRITWSQAESQAEDWAKAIAVDPLLAAAAGALLPVVKQAASDAIDWAETAIGAVAAPATATIEATLDGILVKLPLGSELTPFVNDGIDKIVAMAVAEAQAWGLKVKGELAAKPSS